ncbi:MAG: hypothetical protein KGL39_22535 [Patescibacteria group bacterium]|nr:hypothetical protein [Patescibacteria group bacterium]
MKHTPPRPHVDQSPRPPMRGILLEDLVTEGTADCAVTAPFSTSNIQEIEQIGLVTAGTFTLGWAPAGQTVQTTPALQWNVSPADMQTALNKLSTIGANGVTVTLGPQSYQNSANGEDPEALNPGLWLVSFTGRQFANLTNPPLLTVTTTFTGTGPGMSISEKTLWADTGRVETVNAVIPVGTPTPMRAGAVVVSVFFPGFGYGVVAVEPRYFGGPY